MTEIYRLRPANNKTIEELKEPYLWFSRPTEYNDDEDSNIFAFVEKNESIKLSFERIFGDYKEITELSKLTGICCFTKTLPATNIWAGFPKGHNGIVVKYDKQIIEEHFKSNIELSNCFKEIEYLDNPTLFKRFSKHDILWEKSEKVERYKSLKAIEQCPHLRDELFLKMFTRINDNYSFQNEARIILGGENIPDKSEDINGYKILIPKDSILCIYTHPNTPDYLIKEMKKLDVEILNY